jgi:hypothetical protein
MITITSCQIDSNLGSWPNKKINGKKYVKEACWLNLYPTTNHGSCRFQFWAWPFWSPYLWKLCLVTCTICSTNLFTSRWSHEIMWWLISDDSYNSWNSPWNFVPWLMKTSTGAPNLLSTLPKNYNQLKKCLKITKTY